jgi:hypothetical protein
MAVQHSYGKIVTDGLVLSLDASDRNSYVSGSTIWNDLAGSSVSGSLTNGPTFSSAGNGSSIVFDGTDDYITVPYNSSLEFCNSNNDLPFSFSVWCYINNLTNQFTLHNKGDNGNGNQESYTASVTTSGIFYFTLYDQNGSNQSQIFSISTVPTGSWVNLVGTYSGTGGNAGAALYVNSVLQLTNTASFGTYVRMRPQLTGLFLGSFGSTGTFKSIQSNGRYASFTFYNRSLTSTEILQNYNAQKSRFGLT